MLLYMKGVIIMFFKKKCMCFPYNTQHMTLWQTFFPIMQWKIQINTILCHGLLTANCSGAHRLLVLDILVFFPAPNTPVSTHKLSNNPS